MTVQQFKERYPHLAHLEGDALWNAMEDSMLQKPIGPIKQKPVYDWKGNLVKAGDEMCIITVKKREVRCGLMFPNGFNIEPEIGPEEDCWIVGDYVKLWSVDNGNLFYTTLWGEFTIHQDVSMYTIMLDSKRQVIAIKGVPDSKPEPQ
jgi:hypothetical protein